MEMKMYQKDFSRIGWKMLLSTILIFAIQIGCQQLVLMLKPEWMENYDIMFAAGMVPLYVVGYPVAFLLMKQKDTRRMEKHSMKPWQILLAFMMAYALLVAGNLVGLGLTAGIGLLKGEPVTNALLNVITGSNIWISAIYIVLLAPAFEEILFRKLICDPMVKYGQGTAIVVSGIVFGLFHMNFNQFFYAFLLGCFLAFIYVKTGDIKYSIILHMMINFVGSVVGGLLLTEVDMESPIGMGIYAVYSLCIYAVVIVGIVLWVINKSKMTVEPGDVAIEKGKRFKTVIVNPGMLLYCIVCLVIMIVQAFM
ncbi:MAG: CPBP family intramembrane metalloprotease [Lachnospiraceae bacterium]|nr:CPBP family intramembrane metalloprotease [Lachnospiraceae bacterium]